MLFPHAYCTYFDSAYLPRGLALIESLRSNGDNSPVWVMALDDAARSYLVDAAIPGVNVVPVDALEQTVPGLLALKTARSRMEYYFTCTPLLLRWVMNHYAEPTTVIYLDSDLYFFDDPSKVLAAMGDASIGIIEHRYVPRLQRRLGKYGRFNVGWVGFAPDANGRQCLDWWGERTLEWCSDTPDAGRYADQGYLDWFPEKFDGVRALQPVGLNLAPWNTARYTLALEHDRVQVDDDPLVFFHFHGLRRSGRWYITAQSLYGALLGSVLRSHVYEPYVHHLERLTRLLSESVAAPAVAGRRGRSIRGLLFQAQRAAIKLGSIATGTAIRLDSAADSHGATTRE